MRLSHWRPGAVVRLAIGALLLASLAACDTLGGHKPVAGGHVVVSAKARQQLIEQLPWLQAQGRLASAELKLRADFHFKQAADQFTLRLQGPFGAGATELSGTADSVTVRRGGDTTVTDDPQGWLQQNMGWNLPLQRLHYWMAGLPDSRAPSQVKTGADGLISRLQQDGWTLDYPEYQTIGTLPMPRRIDATNGQVRFQFLIDRWDLPAAEEP